MSRLYFAPLSEAFYLGSDQIKDTQAEILKLKNIISDSSISNLNGKKINENNQSNNVNQRIGYSDETSVKFNSKNNDIDTNLIKLIQHPKFEDIVKNYIIVKHPEWVNGTLNSTEFIPNKKNNKMNTMNTTSYLKQSFGNMYSTTVCSNIKNYLYFFIFALIVYLCLKKLLKN